MERGSAMSGRNIDAVKVGVTLDLKTAALVHKLFVTGIYHARLSQAEFENAKRGQEIFESLLLQTGYYSPAELRMVLDSAGKIITVAP
jgi:hypothetical protein